VSFPPSSSETNSALPIRIVVADDVPYMREAIRRLLQTRPEYVVCGEAENGRAAVEVTTALRPDLVIMDVSMPIMNGLEAAAEISTLSPAIPVLILSNYDLKTFLERSKRLGVRGYVLKGESPAALFSAVRSALCNRPFFYDEGCFH
jgi:two-component system, NarL family, nitrate/nitrite response regulator NarL